MLRKKNQIFTVKEKKFLSEYKKNGGDQTKAAAVAYNTKHPDIVGASVVKRPHMAKAIAQVLEDLYPNYDAEFVGLLQKAAQHAMSSGATPKEVLETIKTLADITGLKAAKQIEKKELKASVKFPGMKD